MTNGSYIHHKVASHIDISPCDDVKAVLSCRLNIGEESGPESVALSTR